LKKVYAKAALGLIAVIFLFAVGSFLRENWAADEEPGAIEAFLARLIRGEPNLPEGNIRNPYQPTEANLQEGREHYEKQCAFCHGTDGRGQGDPGIQFYPPVPSLADLDAEMTDARMHFIILRGIRYTAMPSFAKVLTPEEAWKVVLWVRGLSGKPDASSKNFW